MKFQVFAHTIDVDVWLRRSANSCFKYQHRAFRHHKRQCIVDRHDKVNQHVKFMSIQNANDCEESTNRVYVVEEMRAAIIREAVYVSFVYDWCKYFVKVSMTSRVRLDIVSHWSVEKVNKQTINGRWSRRKREVESINIIRDQRETFSIVSSLDICESDFEAEKFHRRSFATTNFSSMSKKSCLSSSPFSRCCSTMNFILSFVSARVELKFKILYSLH